MRRDVVEVQNGCAAQFRGQLPGEGALSGAGVPVDADQADRAAGGRQPVQMWDEVVNGSSWEGW